MYFVDVSKILEVVSLVIILIWDVIKVPVCSWHHLARQCKLVCAVPSSAINCCDYISEWEVSVGSYYVIIHGCCVMLSLVL